MSSNEKSAKDTDKGGKNDKGHEEKGGDEDCAIFEPQTWRRYQCKNCFRTREEHEVSKVGEPNGSPRKARPKDGPGSTVSSMAAKFQTKSEENTSKGAKGKSKGSTAATADNTTDKSGSQKTGGDSLIAQRTAGLFKKEADTYIAPKGKDQKGKGVKKGKWGSEDVGKAEGKGGSQNGTKKVGTLAPATSKKGPLASAVIGKKAGSQSPATSTKGSVSSLVGEKAGSLSPTLSKKGSVSSLIGEKAGSLSPALSKKGSMSSLIGEKAGSLSPALSKKGSVSSLIGEKAGSLSPALSKKGSVSSLIGEKAGSLSPALSKKGSVSSMIGEKAESLSPAISPKGSVSSLKGEETASLSPVTSEKGSGKEAGSLLPATSKKGPVASLIGEKTGSLSPVTSKEGPVSSLAREKTGSVSPATSKKGSLSSLIGDAGTLSSRMDTTGVTELLSPSVGIQGDIEETQQDNEAINPTESTIEAEQTVCKDSGESSADAEDINKHMSDSSLPDDSPTQETPSGGDASDECTGTQSTPTVGGGDGEGVKIVESVTAADVGEEGDEKGVESGYVGVRGQGDDASVANGMVCEQILAANQTDEENKAKGGEVTEVCEEVSFSPSLTQEEEQVPTGHQQPGGIQRDSLGGATNIDTVPDTTRGPTVQTPPSSPTTTAMPPGVQDEHHPPQQQQQQDSQSSAEGCVDADAQHSPLPIPETPLAEDVQGSHNTLERDGEGQTPRANQREAGLLDGEDPTAPSSPGGSEVGGEVGVRGDAECRDAGAVTTQGAERGQGTDGHTDAGREVVAASVVLQEEDKEDITQGGIKHSPFSQTKPKKEKEEEDTDASVELSLTPALLSEDATFPLQGADPSTSGVSPLLGEQTGASPVHTPPPQVAVVGGTTTDDDSSNSDVVIPEAFTHSKIGANDTLPPAGDIHTTTPPPQIEGTGEETGGESQAADAELPRKDRSVSQNLNEQIEIAAHPGSQQHQETEEENSSVSAAETDSEYTQLEGGDTTSGAADEDNAAFHATFVLTTEASQETETDEDFKPLSASEETKPQETISTNVTEATESAKETTESGQQVTESATEAKESNTETTASAAETTVSITEVTEVKIITASTAEAKESPIEATNYATEAKEIAAEATLNVPEATASVPEVTDSTTETIETATLAAESVIEVLERPTEATAIATEATWNATETTENATEATESPTGATESLTETATSTTETTESCTEATECITEATQSYTEATGSTTEAKEGTIEATVSATDVTESSIEATASTTEVRESYTEATDSTTEAKESPTEALVSATVVTESSTIATVSDAEATVTSTEATSTTEGTESFAKAVDSTTDAKESHTEDTVNDTDATEIPTEAKDIHTEATETAIEAAAGVPEAAGVENILEAVSSSQAKTPELFASGEAEITLLSTTDQEDLHSPSHERKSEGHTQEEVLDSEISGEPAAVVLQEQHKEEEGSGDHTSHITTTGEDTISGGGGSAITGVNTTSPLPGEQQPPESTPVLLDTVSNADSGAQEVNPPGGTVQTPERPTVGGSECLPVYSAGGATEEKKFTTSQTVVLQPSRAERLPPGGICEHHQEDEQFSHYSPCGSGLQEELADSAEIIVLECTPEGDTAIGDQLAPQQEVEGTHQVSQEALSPDDGSELWFEAETELSPPAAFSDTTGTVLFPSATIGGATTNEQLSSTHGVEGSGEVAALGVRWGGADIGSPLEGLQSPPPGEQELPLQCNTGKDWRSGVSRSPSEPEVSVGLSSLGGEIEAVTGGGLLAIAVPITPITADSDYTTGLLSVTTVTSHEEEEGGYLRIGEGDSPHEAVSPLVVRPSEEAPQAVGGAALLLSGGAALLAPLTVEVASDPHQGPPQQQTPPPATPPVEAALSDVTQQGVAPEVETLGSSVVGEPQRPGGAAEEGPTPWSSIHLTGGAAPDGGVGATQATTTHTPPADHPNPSPPIIPPIPPGGEVASASLIITATSRNTSDTDADNRARTESAQTPEVVLECGPVIADTFSPRVSSPVSASSGSQEEVKVAAATISLKQPSLDIPFQQEPQVAQSQRTCVSKVASFIISAPQPEQQRTRCSLTPERKSVDIDNNFANEPNQTLIINNSKYDYDSGDDVLSEGYGGYPQGGSHTISDNNQRKDGSFDNNNLEEEATTTITTVNVKNKKKVRQRPAHQQLQFDYTYQRSSSVPDNNIFCIATHKPEDSGQQGAERFNFDRTLQFGPSGRQRRRRMSDAFVREDAMMEGTRMLIENLREKQHLLEEKCARLEREKSAVSDLLTVKKHELQKFEARSSDSINALEITCMRLEAENVRLLERLNLPETDRNNFRDQELELSDLRRKLAEAEEVISQLSEDSACLQHEVKDMHLEMEEMHDQFRDDEALEFRDMQKELEATAKNCRILQFKLRKSERRNDALQSERLHLDEKIRQLEHRTSNNNEQHHIRELEEELRMAKEVSVRLHDELEATEDRRAKFQDELERVHDVLMDSEKGRGVLQKEVLTLTEEVEQLRERVLESKDDLGDKLDVPRTKKPTLSKTGSQGSQEYDVEQLMRDLADSLEREHDLKGQLEHAEEETVNFRKKLSDLEDENEVIQIQLQKMSAAKSGKYFQRSAEDGDQSSEEEHGLRLQLELAEEEINVLRRKVDEMDLENANMTKEVRRLQLKLAGKDSKEEEPQEDTRTYDERITAMACDIDDLKWRLIQKDQESASKDDVEREPKDQESDRGLPVSRPVKLSKSLSLDSGAVTADIWSQLDSATLEAGDLREKICQMEKENDDLRARIKTLELGVPTITTDDAPIKNIELQDTIQSLKTENAQLRDTIRSLDDRTTALSRDVNKVNDGRMSESADLKEQLGHLEEDVTSLQRTISELQESNKKLSNDLRQYEQTDEGKESKATSDELNLETATKRQLRERIRDLESNSRILNTILRNRESENEALEQEVEEYRADMDKMFDKFKDRELNLQMEIQSWEQKNVVLSNLLDLVTERAESFKSSPSEKQSERSTSVVSAVSDVTMGSDEVFGERSELDQDWDEKFLCRIRSLEDLLKEERLKVQVVEKRLQVKDGEQSALTDDMKLHEREKEILQQELILCQRQLSETTEQSQALREKLDTMHKIQNILREDFQRVSKELDIERSILEDYKRKLDAKEAEGKKTAARDEEKEKKGPSTRDAKFVGVGGLKDKEPASWRWEKQQFENTIKDLRKKSDDLHRQLSRQQVRVKMAGDDVKPRLGRQDSVEADSGKSKELETEVKALKDEAEKRKADIDTMDKQIKELQSTLKCQEEHWNTEREVLEGDRKAVIKELTQKDEVLKGKDEIIKSKNSLLKQKEAALKMRENSMLNHDMIMKEKDDIITKLQDMQNELHEQVDKLKDEVKQHEDAHNEMELKIKEINASVSARDGRIKEKDDIIEKLNRSLSEKESNISDMDNAIRQAMKSMDDKEADIKKLLAESEEQKIEIVNLKNKSDDLEQTLHNTEKEHGKEIASLVILREKMEALFQQLKTEKALLEGELQDIKRVMMEKEDFWRSCRNQLENDLRSATEKLQTLEGVHSKGNQSEVIMKLTVEKDDLTNEKNILVKEVKRLAHELENAEMEWTQEKHKLSQAISSKEGEVSELQARLSGQPEESAAAPPSPSAPTVDPRAEILRKAELASVEELYENKLKIARQQIRQALEEIDQMRRENSLARDLLLSSQKTLSEVKHKYDVTVTTWHEEKATLERRAAESDDRRRQVEALQRVVEQLEAHVTQLETERTDLNGKVMKIKADWDADKLQLQLQANKYDEQAAMTASGKFKWSERNKREAAWDSERANHQRALTEYQNLVRDLEVRAKTAERTRDREQKELQGKLESLRKTMDREVTDLRKRCAESEERATVIAGLQKTLIDLQCKLQSDREHWLHERTELQRQLSECEKLKLNEKNKFTELLAEVKRVKELTPLLSKSEAGGVELEILHKQKPESPQASPSGTVALRSPHSQDLSPGSQREHTGNSVVTTIPILRLVDEPYDKPLIEALQRISQLAEDLNKISIKRSSNATGPPAFRRSLSTSEVEEYREYVEYAHQYEEESQSHIPDPHLQTPDSAPTRTGAAVDNFRPMTRVPAAPPISVDNSMDDLTSPLRGHGSFRSRFPSAVPDSQVSTIAERASRPGSARNSMYASGTQSAYTSRDASPERRFGPRKITPYPVAPPSFLITPSRTPRRVTSSMDREIAMPEKHLQKLYDKLSAIEREQTDEELKTQQQLEREGSVEAHIEATDSRRKSGMRMLVKSMSVDSYREDPNWMPTDAAPGPNAHFCPKQLDRVFDDAPQSQTLPASVRFGQTMIIPGSEQQPAADYSDLTNRVEYLSKRRKSQDARKEFYDNYPLYSSGFFSWPRKSRRDRHQEEMMSALAATEEVQEAEVEAQQENTAEQKPAMHAATAAVAPQQQQPEPKKTIVPFGKHKKKKEKEADAEKKESKLSYFFSSVKERRNMFMKKSRSVDESPVRKSVMKAGLQAGQPAAPSTFEPPKEKPKVVAKEAKPPLPSTPAASKPQPSSLRQKIHKRATSLDVTALFSVSSGVPANSEQGASSLERSHNRHSSTGSSSGATVMTSSVGHTAGSGSKDQSRDGRKF